MSADLSGKERTVYLSNFDFSLTNNDLHQILDKFGAIARITIMKDRETRRSKGVAFILFVEKESAVKCVEEMNDYSLNGRTLKCSIAKENGRGKEFVKRREYSDKSRCFECGEEGHLSYTCPKNSLGSRVVKKKKKVAKDKPNRKRQASDVQHEESDDDVDEESLSYAIQSQQQKVEEEKKQFGSPSSSSHERKKLKFKKSSYFSDEEEEIYE